MHVLSRLESVLEALGLSQMVLEVKDPDYDNSVRFLRHLEALWSCLELSWSCLGGVLRPSEALLCMSCAVLSQSWSLLDCGT